MIVLDTNVVSAVMWPERNPIVTRWLDQQPVEAVWLTAVTFLEIRYGILILPQGRRRSGLTAAFERIVDSLLVGQILPFDREAAACSAEIAAGRRRAGRTVAPNDTQIAGIAMSRNATLATRNVRDFDDLDLRLVDPWAQ